MTTYATLLTNQTGVDIATVPGGSLSAQTLHFAVLARSRQGFNLPSNLTQLNIAAGSKVVITLNPAARPAGTDPLYFAIAASPTNDPADLRWIASWKANDPAVVGGVAYLSQGTARALPHTIELTTDEQLQLGAIVADSTSLPVPWEGALRYVQSLGKYLRFEPDASAGEVAAAGGYWIEHDLGWTDEPDKYRVYVGSTAGPGGCDRNLLSTPDIIPFPLYRPDGGTQAIAPKYLIPNGLSEDGGSPILASAAIGLIVSVDGQPKEIEFSGKVFARYLGLYRYADGSLATNHPMVGVEQPIFVYPVAGRNTTTLKLHEAIPRGHGALWEVYLRFHEGELLSQFVDGTTFRSLIYSQGIGSDPAPAAVITGSFVTDADEKLLIVPRSPGAVEMRPGGAWIATPFGGYSFPSAGHVSEPLAPDAANQKICISATLAGQPTVKQAGQDPNPDSAQRALVSTMSGSYSMSGWSDPVVLDAVNRSVQVAVFHACDANGKGTVRASYPDKMLANKTVGNWNVAQLRVIVEVNGTRYETSVREVASAQPSQQFIVTEDVTQHPILASTPDSSSDPGFCLWDYAGQPVASAIAGGNLPAGATVRVGIAYHWDVGNREVTAISHAVADGNIFTLSVPLVEALQAFEAVRSPVATVALLRAIPYQSIPDWQSCFVGALGAPVRFDPGIPGNVERGDGIFYPNDKPVGALGAWIIKEGY